MSIQIIGSSHIARESIEAISKRILEEKPEIVAVELDRYRLPYLFEPRAKVRARDALKIGLMGYLFNAIGGWLQRKLGEKVGLSPGADMRAAIRAGKQAGSYIALIDRPIQITMQRLSTQMSFLEKMKFVFYLLGGFVLPAPKDLSFDLSKVPEQKLVLRLTTELYKKFPAIYKVLIKERDEYMAKQIKWLVEQSPHAKIIVVVGAGHIQGLQRALRNLF